MLCKMCIFVIFLVCVDSNSGSDTISYSLLHPTATIDRFLYNIVYSLRCVIEQLTCVNMVRYEDGDNICVIWHCGNLEGILEDGRK